MNDDNDNIYAMWIVSVIATDRTPPLRYQNCGPNFEKMYTEAVEEIHSLDLRASHQTLALAEGVESRRVYFGEHRADMRNGGYLRDLKWEDTVQICVRRVEFSFAEDAIGTKIHDMPEVNHKPVSRSNSRKGRHEINVYK